MPMIHFLPLLPETSAPYTVPSSGSSSASSSRSSSISYTTGPSVHSLLGQIRTLTDSLNGGAAVSHVEDIDNLNREVDYLSYFISAPLSLTPKLPGPSTVEVSQFNAAIRELNEALAVYGESGRESRSSSSGHKTDRKGRESRHRHKLSASHQRTEEETRLRLLRRYE